MEKQAARRYDPAFKLDTVKQYLQGGRTFVQLSKEVGVSPDSLSDWVKAYKKTSAPATKKSSPPAAPKPATPKSEKKTPAESEVIARLRKELAIACQERDILEQALRIFSARK